MRRVRVSLSTTGSRGDVQPLVALALELRALIEAARATGLRSILSRGWGNLDRIDSGADGISIGDVDHQKLFERVAAVVHHDGAGTTTAAGAKVAAQLLEREYGRGLAP